MDEGILLDSLPRAERPGTHTPWATRRRRGLDGEALSYRQDRHGITKKWV